MSDTSDKKKPADKKDVKSDSAVKDGQKASEPTKTPSKDGASDKSKAASSSSSKTSSVPGGGAKTASANAQTQRSGGSGIRPFFVLILVLGFLGGGAYATRDVWLASAEPYLEKIPGYSGATSDATVDEPPSEQPSVVDALTGRIAALEAKLATSAGSGDMAALMQESERARAELSSALSRIDDLERRLDEVRSLASAMTNSDGASVDLEPILSRIDSIEKSSRAASSEIASLAQKVETASASVSSGAAGQGAVLAVAQLRDAALAGRPYQAQLDALNTVAVGNSELMAAASRLKDTSSSGLPSIDMLEKDFADIAGDIVAQTRAGSDDWVDQALGKLSTLVSLRRTDGGSGNVIEDAVATIAAELKERDVAAAAKSGRALYDALEPSVQNIMEPWLLDAETRALAVRALDAMHASALAALGR